MKGLTEVSPAVARVKIDARAARKHYGIQSHKRFNEWLHDRQRRYLIPCLHRNGCNILIIFSIDFGAASEATIESTQWTGLFQRSSILLDFSLR